MSEHEKFSPAELKRFRDAWGNRFDASDPADRLAMTQLIRADREYAIELLIRSTAVSARNDE